VPSSGGASDGGSGGEPPKDPKELTVRQLVELLKDSPSYVVHRTKAPDAGTCQVPLVPETDPERMKNPMAPIGIYATVGVSGLGDYGEYGVVIRRDAFPWSKHEGPVVIYRGENAIIDPSQAVGYYRKETMEAAMKIHKG
jgi:hypothetical protein